MIVDLMINAVKTVIEFVKLCLVTAIILAALHLAVAFTSFQLFNHLWTCSPIDQKWYHPLDCFGQLMAIGLAEIVVVAFGIAWVIRALVNWRPPPKFHSVDDIRAVPTPPPRTPSPPTDSSDVEPESYKEASPFIVLAPAPWQASIWSTRDGKRTLLGHANRIAGHLVTNFHVLQAASVDTLDLVVLRPGKEAYITPLNQFQFELVQDCDDIVAADLSKVKAAIPGLKEASIKHVHGFQPVYIATDFPENNASSSGLRNHPESWGMVVYEGSTRPGFSGAGYCHGNSLFGIHSHGGIHNVGYSASYVALKIKKPESSDYYALRDMLDRSRDKNYTTRRAHNPDEIEVQFQGRYFIIEDVEYQELEDEYGYQDGRQQRHQKRKEWRRRQEWEEHGGRRLLPGEPIPPLTEAPKYLEANAQQLALSAVPDPPEEPHDTPVPINPPPPPSQPGPVPVLVPSTPGAALAGYLPEHANLLDTRCQCSKLEAKIEWMQEELDRTNRFVEDEVYKARVAVKMMEKRMYQVYREVAGSGAETTDDEVSYESNSLDKEEELDRMAEEITSRFAELRRKRTEAIATEPVPPEPKPEEQGNAKLAQLREKLERETSMAGPDGAMPHVTVSPKIVLPSVPSDTSQTASILTGLNQISERFETALKSIQASQLEQTRAYNRLMQENASFSKHGLASAIKSAINSAMSSYPEQKRAGYGRRAHSISPGRRASGRSPTTTQSAQRSVGTASGSQIKQTGPVSNTSPPPASTTSPPKNPAPATK